MREELYRVIKKGKHVISLQHNQYSALKAGLPFISGLLFAARPLYDHAGNNMLSRGCVRVCGLDGCHQGWKSSDDATGLKV